MRRGTEEGEGEKRCMKGGQCKGVCVCVWVGWKGVNDEEKCNNSRFCATVTPPRSPSLYIYSKPPTLSTLITQIGFPGDEGTRKEKGGTGGVLDIVLVRASGSDSRSDTCIQRTPYFTI